jgi:hypothetical protein
MGARVVPYQVGVPAPDLARTWIGLRTPEWVTVGRRYLDDCQKAYRVGDDAALTDLTDRPESSGASGPEPLRWPE